MKSFAKCHQAVSSRNKVQSPSDAGPVLLRVMLQGVLFPPCIPATCSDRASAIAQAGCLSMSGLS